MKLSFAILYVVFAVYIPSNDAIIPKECTVIVDECKKWGPQVKDWIYERCCKKCGHPISFSAAKSHIEEATKRLAEAIIPYVENKIPKLKPKKITPQWICEVAKAIEEAFNHHNDLCKFDMKNKQHKAEVEKCKSIAINKAMPKAMGMLSLAGECKKGVGIPTHIMNDIPTGKSSGPPIHIIKLMDELCLKACASAKGKK